MKEVPDDLKTANDWALAGMIGFGVLGVAAGAFAAYRQIEY
jgi:hypothetical protein